MTAPTPEYLRTLAENDALIFIEVGEDIRAALRAAADQIEAVLDWTDAALVSDPDMNRAFNDGYECAARDLLDILTADTAPQEERDA